MGEWSINALTRYHSTGRASMSQFWSRGLENLAAYVPGEQPKDRRYIKLNTNENPYPPSPAVLEAIAGAADERLRLYPDPTCMSLRTTIAQYHGLEPENVFVGNGSDEILAFAFPAFLRQDEPILYPDISYSFYPVYSDFFAITARTIPLNEDFTIPASKYLVPSGGVVLSNPNAPTSIMLGVQEIESIVRHALDIHRVVIVDEAYIDFGGISVDSMVSRYPNLLVVRTLSKSRSLAGLRAGYALGSAGLIDGLERVKSCINSYTMDRVALAAAEASFKDEAWFQNSRNMVIATRERVAGSLKDLGFSLPDSASNFIFPTHSRVPARFLYTRLREQGILVRYFPKPRIDNHLRVSIGTDAEMDTFIGTIRKILEEYSEG